MTTDEKLPFADLSAAFLCPQCHQAIEVCDTACPACGVDLAWAAALAEQQILATLPAAAGTQALQQALQQLAALSELKASLVSNLSHALRSPVVPIRGYSSMLVEGRLGPLTPSQQDAIETILRCANQLDATIDQMGQFTANLKGQLKLQPTRVLIPSLVERLEHACAPRARAAQVNLRFDVAPNLPPVSADSEKIWWVLFQLFDHPLQRMTAGDTLTLTITTGEGRVRFTVQDTAPNLPLTPHDELSQLAQARGCSLAQIRRIVEAHGTRFTLESQPERGTTVWFDLPTVFALQP